MHRAHTDASDVAAVTPLPVAVVAHRTASPAALDSGQLDAERARDRLREFIVAFKGSAQAAIDHLNGHLAAGTLPTRLTWAFANAWDKKRVNSRLNLSTLNKWKAVNKTRGRSAPLKKAKDTEIKPWHGLALTLMARPQKPTILWVTEQIAAQWDAAWGAAPPSYHAVRRAFHEKLSVLDQKKGRHTGSALKALTHFKPRSAVGLLPWDELHADGWNTHFTAPHPITGEYVTYEVWHAHDVATRYVPPFGVGLTENFEVIAKCVENAVREGGVMCFLQTDSTRIVKNSKRFKTNPATAIADRAGFTIVHPKEVGNSQANGIAENFNTWLDRESRELATYQHGRMDTLTFKRVKKITGQMVKAQETGDMAEYHRLTRDAARMGKGLVLTSHSQALDWLEAKRQKWNDKPHRSLPKINTPGGRRHQSPNEAIAAARAAGWVPVMVAEEHMIDLFRPHVQVKVTRGAVSPYGGMRYRHEDLDAWLGKEVVVAYDQMDWRQVWVKTLKGESICIAGFAEATGYRCVTAQQDAEEKRALAQIKTKQRGIENIVLRHPGALLEQAPVGELIEVVFDRVAPPPELISIDYLSAPPKDEELSHEDTIAWLYQGGEEPGQGQPGKESATG